MIRVEVLEKFSLERFDELKNITRSGKNEEGYLYPGDTFECTQDLVEYLTGGNKLGKVVVKVIEVVPEISKEKSPLQEKVEKLYEDYKEKQPKKKKSKK